MTRLFQLLETVAATNSTILITGETGTGKEVVARAIHHNSPRRMHRFVALNCSAIPETLLEAELFGHVRGAFTGAVGNRQGRLEQAHKGTLFLDEVGTMSTALQMKLLRVLQEREFERVGDSHTTKVDVRVIAATNSDLAKMVADGTVPRGSLLPAERHPGAAAAAARSEGRHSAARAALSREVPGARRRTGDVRAAAHGVAGGHAAADGVSTGRATSGSSRTRSSGPSHSAAAGRRSTWTICRRSSWRPVPTPLRVGGRAARKAASISTSFIASIERELIERSLERTGGNKGQAAQLLNLKRTTLVEKLKRFRT